MRERKRSFCSFKYRECDAFAKYLEEQAAKGWHFKEWRLGFVFEKGDPKDVKYSVEVFPKGNERDCRPEKDAEEFAEYCRAAGWELVDGRRKFCIFKALRKDAVPIAAPEERYENICKAERVRLYAPLLWFLNMVFYIWGTYGNISGWGFQMASFLYMMGCMGMLVLLVIDAAAAVIWRRNRRKLILRGEVPVYGKSIGLNFWAAMCVIMLCTFAGRLMEYGIFNREVIQDLIMIFALILFMTVMGIAAALFRPSIERRVQAEWILMAVLMIWICMMLIYTDEDSVSISQENVPLLLEDFKDADGEVFITGRQSESLLGKRYNYYVSYGDDESYPDELQYTAYTSKYSGIIDRLWNTRDGWGNVWRQEPNEEDEWEDVTFTDCTKLWDAEEAWVSQPRFYIEKDGCETRIEKYCYEVKYPQSVLVIWTMEELDAENVQKILFTLRSAHLLR